MNEFATKLQNNWGMEETYLCITPTLACSYTIIWMYSIHVINRFTVLPDLSWTIPRVSPSLSQANPVHKLKSKKQMWNIL